MEPGTRGGAPPTLAVVIALGRLGREVAADVQELFLRGDRRRVAATKFLALVSGDGGPAWVAPQAEAPVEGDALSRRQACERVLAGAAALQDGLELALSDLHTSERLHEAGLAEVRTLALDVLVLADLAEPAASGALVPIVALIFAIGVAPGYFLKPATPALQMVLVRLPQPSAMAAGDPHSRGLRGNQRGSEEGMSRHAPGAAVFRRADGGVPQGATQQPPPLISSEPSVVSPSSTPAVRSGHSRPSRASSRRG